MKLEVGEYVERKEFTLDEMKLLAGANGGKQDLFAFCNTYYGEWDGFGLVSKPRMKANVTEKYKQWLKENNVKEFTKNDLKDGMVVTHRNGAMGVMFGGNAWELPDFEYEVDFSYCKDDLTNQEMDDFDIIKVEYMGDVLWERKEQRKKVKIGENEYYEDELSEALSKIKPV
jgi:hypothetical protein